MSDSQVPVVPQAVYVVYCVTQFPHEDDEIYLSSFWLTAEDAITEVERHGIETDAVWRWQEVPAGEPVGPETISTERTHHD